MRMASEREVVPWAWRPAKRTAVLTWAEGMGVVKSMAVSGWPTTVMGAWPPMSAVAAGEVDLGAHLRERFADALHGASREGGVAGEDEGVRMRGDEAGEHAHGGAGVAAVEVVLGLLEVSGGAGDARWCRLAVISTVAPSWAMQARVEWGSAPVEKLVRRVVPSARPASMA